MMGYMRHHVIVVSSWDDKLIALAHDEATKIFPHVSGIVLSECNAYKSFFVPPDGSKEGWDDSDKGDKRRNTFVTWLKKQAFEDGSTSLNWVEVQYDDDENETLIVRDSDHDDEHVE
jgi:hypothetical protein